MYIQDNHQNITDKTQDWKYRPDKSQGNNKEGNMKEAGEIIGQRKHH